MNETGNNAGANAPQKSNGMATAALVLGIVSIVFCWVVWLGAIAGILAIVLAIVAKNKIKQDPNMGGKGAANGGLITGIIGLIITVIIIILVALVFTAVGEFGDAFEEGMKNSDFQKSLDSLSNL